MNDNGVGLQMASLKAWQPAALLGVIALCVASMAGFAAGWTAAKAEPVPQPQTAATAGDDCEVLAVPKRRTGPVGKTPDVTSLVPQSTAAVETTAAADGL